jgi:transposase
MDATIQEFAQELKCLSGKKITLRIVYRVLIILLHLLNFNTGRIGCLLGISKKTSLFWIAKYQKDGLNSIFDQNRSGRPPFIIIANNKKSEQKIVHIQLIREMIFKLFKKSYSLSGVYNFAKKCSIRKVIPRTLHEKNNPQKMSEWTDDFQNKIDAIKTQFPDKEIEIYFQDESRYGQMTIKSGVWSPTPVRPEFKTQVGYLNAWIYATASKSTGKYFGMILPNLNAFNMQIFLDEFSKNIPSNKHVVMILDGASAHTSRTLCIPKNVSLLLLPPYSPELNPIERLWSFLKRNYLSFKIYENIEEVIQKGQDAWRRLNQKIVKSIMCSQAKLKTE